MRLVSDEDPVYHRIADDHATSDEGGARRKLRDENWVLDKMSKMEKAGEFIVS
jgi:hypothetical protein